MLHAILSRLELTCRPIRNYSNPEARKHGVLRSGEPQASGPPFVNRLHDFLRPPHRIRDCADRRRNSFAAIELCQLPRSENTRRDQRTTGVKSQVRNFGLVC